MVVLFHLNTNVIKFYYLCWMMNDILTYRVAEFCFTTEGLPLEMANLLPFVVQSADHEPIFSIKVVQQLPKAEKELIFKNPDRPGFPVIALYSQPDGYFFEFQFLPGRPVSGRMAVSADFRQAEIELNGIENRYTLNSAMMLLFTFTTAQKGALEMHASVVVNSGRGYLFLGKSGTGKSTHSQLWIKNIPGTELLNDDNPIVRLLPDGSVRVYGSPWSGKTPCYKAKDVPVGAIVHLNQAPYNKIYRQPVIQAYASLMESASSFRPLKEYADGWHKTMEGICAAVPFYRLECLPDNEAALLCYNTVNG